MEHPVIAHRVCLEHVRLGETAAPTSAAAAAAASDPKAPRGQKRARKASSTGMAVFESEGDASHGVDIQAACVTELALLQVNWEGGVKKNKKKKISGERRGVPRRRWVSFLLPKLYTGSMGH